MESRELRRLAMDVETRMRLAFRSQSQRVFWPEQFTDNEFGTLDNVVRAFRRLYEDGKVDLIVDVVCQDGHRVWSGHPEDVSTAPIGYCAKCEDPTDIDVTALLRAEITDDWVGALRTEDSLSKKKVSGCHM
jgi:hypothetical protein